MNKRRTRRMGRTRKMRKVRQSRKNSRRRMRRTRARKGGSGMLRQTVGRMQTPIGAAAAAGAGALLDTIYFSPNARNENAGEWDTLERLDNRSRQLARSTKPVTAAEAGQAYAELDNAAEAMNRPPLLQGQPLAQSIKQSLAHAKFRDLSEGADIATRAGAEERAADAAQAQQSTPAPRKTWPSPHSAAAIVAEKYRFKPVKW